MDPFHSDSDSASSTLFWKSNSRWCRIRFVCSSVTGFFRASLVIPAAAVFGLYDVWCYAWMPEWKRWMCVVLLTGFIWDWVTKCNGTDGWGVVDSFIRSFVLSPAFGLYLWLPGWSDNWALSFMMSGNDWIISSLYALCGCGCKFSPFFLLLVFG